MLQVLNAHLGQATSQLLVQALMQQSGLAPAQLELAHLPNFSQQAYSAIAPNIGQQKAAYLMQHLQSLANPQPAPPPPSATTRAALYSTPPPTRVPAPGVKPPAGVTEELFQDLLSDSGPEPAPASALEPDLALPGVPGVASPSPETETGFPTRVHATDIVNPDFAVLAQAYGGFGATVAETADFEPALQEAMAANAPAILHLLLDPEAITPDTTLSELSGLAAPD